MGKTPEKPKLVITTMRELCRAAQAGGRSIEDAAAWAKRYIDTHTRVLKLLFDGMIMDAIRRALYATSSCDRQISRDEWLARGATGRPPPRQCPPRDVLQAMAPAAAARALSILDAYKLPDGRVLGDLRRADLTLLESQRQKQADRFGQEAAFFRALLQRLPDDDSRLRDVLRAEQAEELYAASCASIRPAHQAAPRADAPMPGARAAS